MWQFSSEKFRKNATVDTQGKRKIPPIKLQCKGNCYSKCITCFSNIDSQHREDIELAWFGSEALLLNSD